MKISIPQVMLMILCMGVTYANKAEGQNVLEQKVSISLNNEELKTALNRIENASNVRFVYNHREIKTDRKISLNVKDEQLKEVLTSLLDPLKIRFEVNGNHIILLNQPLGMLKNSLLLRTFDRPVKGKVVDEKNEPVIGATVMLKGTNRATMTDVNGNFTLNIEEAGSVLVVSFIGYNTKELIVGAQTELSIVLLPETQALEEVVVVGYGTQKKVNLTGAVSTISGEDLNKRQVGQTSMALQGIAPGVTVKQSSGQPGSDMGSIRIRGIGTLGNSNPLVLVDNVEMSIDNVDPNLIESISVLKDAASAAIYGSRAANGVILITTKRAKSGEFAVTYNTYLGIQRPTNLPDYVGAIDHMTYMDLANTNIGNAPVFGEKLINEYRAGINSNPDLYPDTHWQKELYTESGLQQNHFVSVAGGSNNVKIMAGLGYFSQTGLIPNTSYDRYTARFNTDIKLTNRLSTRIDIFTRFMKTIEPAPGVSREGNGVLYWLHRLPANQVAKLSSGLWGTGWQGDNPLAYAIDGGLNTGKTPSLSMNLALNYRFTDWLTADVMYSPTYTPQMQTVFSKQVYTYYPEGEPAYIKPQMTSLSETRTTVFNQDVKALLTAAKTFGVHNFTALGGFSQESYWNNFISAMRRDYPFANYPVLNAGGVPNQNANGSGAEWILRSFFGRLNYDFDGRYLFEANLRYDGSSRFAQGRKYGLFPSFSVGYRLIEEDYMAFARSFLSDLKIRASWGKLGNQLIGNYPFISSVVFNSYAQNGEAVTGASIDAMANESISWEATEMRNIALDAGFKNGLSFSFDYYQRITSGILLRLDQPLSTGLIAPYQNAGKVENKGWDLMVNYNLRKKTWRFTAGLSLSDVRNKVLDLRGVSQTGLTVSNEGYPINSLYGYEAIGFITPEDYNTQGDYLLARQFGRFAPGDIKYKDQNGDGVINTSDQVIIGSTIPRYTYGLNLFLGYRNFDFTSFIQGVGKADGYLNNNATMPFFLGGSMQEQHKDSWTPDNQDARFPRMAFNETNNTQNSSFWLKDASYLRMKTLQLGFTFPQKMLRLANLQSVRLYVNGQNLFTIDNFWHGFDVESPIGPGNHYPQTKLYTVGLDLKF